MKKQNIFSAIFMMCMMLVGCIAFTGCGKEDDLDTNQYGNGVSLNVYGPSPVARGGQLRFIGTNLSQITEVVFPGGASVSDIKVVNDREIEVTVPQDAQPGLITLVYASGKITTLTPLAYTEPVGFEAAPFSPATVKAGQKLTIAGEYLNLVTGIEFAEGVLVDKKAFTEHTRKTISLVVPAEAQTGKVAITFCATGDTIPNVIYSDVELNVILPAVAEVKNIEGSKPGDEIIIKGTDFDLITEVRMPNGETVEFKAIDDAVSGIKFKLPASISTGYIRVVPASGVEVVVANNGVAEPSELAATPNADLREGDIITITGKNLDVVTSVSFLGNTGTIAPEEGGTATKIQVKTLPGFQSGDMLLNTGFGVSFPIAISTAKPALESYNPSPVSAGNELTINGKNLDLVAKVTFVDNLAVTEFIAQETSVITLKVPATATSGDLLITMKNGEEVTFSAPEINSPEFCFIPEMPNTSEMKAGDILTVNVVNGDKLTGVKVDGNDCQYILKEDNLYILIPASAGMKSTLTLISSNGTIDYALAVIPSTEQTFVLWTGAADLDGWSWNWQIGDGAAGANNPKMFAEMELQEGDVIRLWATNYNDWWQVQFFDGHWGGQAEIGNATGLNNGNNINSGIYDLAAHGGYIEIPVTATLAEQLTTLNDWGYCWILQGEGVIISKIDVVRTISLETTIWEGELIADDWGNQPYALSDAGAELAAADAKAGQTIRMYITPLDAIWQLEILEGHWGPWYCAFANEADDPKFTIWDLDAHNGAIEFKLTQEMLDAAYVQQWWGGVFVLNGDNVKVTKITIE